MTNGMVERSLVIAALLTLGALLAARLRAQSDAPLPADPASDVAEPPAMLPIPEPFRSFRPPAATSAAPAVATAPDPSSPPPAGPPAAARPPGVNPADPSPPEEAAAAMRSAAVPDPSPSAAASPLPAAAPAPARGAAPTQRLISLSFQDAPVDQVLTLYGELKGRTIIKSPGLNATITLRAIAKLTEDEVCQAIESVLALNNITLVPLGERFLKAVQPAAARMEGMPIQFQPQNVSDRDAMVSRVVELKHIGIAEVLAILPSILHSAYGKAQPLERANAVMITDTESNVARALELIAYIDRPPETKVETRIFELHEAAAADVAQRLNELIADPAQQQRRPTTVIVQPGQPAPPGVIRPPATAAPTVPADLSLAERGVVVGPVKIVPDERTNVLIVICDPVNFPFFENMIAVLDRAVEPETLVKVYSLEYAAADEVADLLTALIGGSSGYRRPRTGSTTESRTSSGAAASRGGTTASADTRSQSIREFIASQMARTTPSTGAAGGHDGEGIGELSTETRILPDLRSNSLLLMGRRTDLTVLEEVIRELDIMLAQVVIEAIIIEVTLSDETSTGIDWLQRSLQAYDTTRMGPGGGLTVREPVMSWGGGFLSSASSAFRSGADVVRDTPLTSGALTYYLTVEGLNVDAVIRLAARDSQARILSTPIILTTDNTEAQIVAGEERPIVTATTVTMGGNQTSAYEYKNIGIELRVKPRINPQRVCVMEVTQTADNVGDIVLIDGNEVPVVTKRELKASVAVENRSTIVMGGLVSQADRASRNKVPVLGDIPLLGRLFRSDSKTKQRTELLVLLTPYVISSPQEARAETRRIHDASNADSSRWFEKGFGDSDLARDRRRARPPLRPDTKLPPRIEQYLDGAATNAPSRSGARTIVVPQMVTPLRPGGGAGRSTAIPTPSAPSQ